MLRKVWLCLVRGHRWSLTGTARFRSRFGDHIICRRCGRVMPLPKSWDLEPLRV